MRPLAEKRCGPDNFRLVEAVQRVMDEVAVDARPQTDLFVLLDVHSGALLCGKKEAVGLGVHAVFTVTEILQIA